MRSAWFLVLVTSLIAIDLRAADQPKADPPKKEPLKITPGKAIVPTDAMRRPWGELVSMDLKTRTGTFRNEGNDEIVPFKVLPYSELYHHAAVGDLQDFQIGERAIFRLHQDAEGKWVWLTYIQDEMNFLNGHKEYYYVDRLDPAKGEIEYTQANADKSFIRGKGYILETDDKTRYWKNGEQVKFADIKVGDRLRAKSHGIGKGKHHRCWEIFLDDVSLEKFQKEQQVVHRQRMEAEGLPGYVDEIGAGTVKLTLFQEARDFAKEMKAGRAVRIAAAGGDRKAGKEVEGVIKEHKQAGNLQNVTLELKIPPEGLTATGVARLWLRP